MRLIIFYIIDIFHRHSNILDICQDSNILEKVQSEISKFELLQNNWKLTFLLCMYIENLEENERYKIK